MNYVCNEELVTCQYRIVFSSQKQKTYLDLETYWRQPKAHIQNTSKCISYSFLWFKAGLRHNSSVLLLLPSRFEWRNIRPESQQNNDIKYFFHVKCENENLTFNTVQSIVYDWLHMASENSYFFLRKNNEQERKNRT